MVCKLKKGVKVKDDKHRWKTDAVFHKVAMMDHTGKNTVERDLKMGTCTGQSGRAKGSARVRIPRRCNVTREERAGEWRCHRQYGKGLEQLRIWTL